MSREQAKAAQYIQQLDRARCNGDWTTVPELVRKIRKHAPERACLTLTAESEHAILQASHGGPSAAMTRNSSGLGHLLVPLAEAIERERKYMEDEFQAQVCLGWVYWVIGEPDEAVSHLPKSIEQDFAQLDGTGKESAAWTKICAVKASYIKAAALSKMGSSAEALETLQFSMPIVSGTFISDAGADLRTWTERFLALQCTLAGRAIRSQPSNSIEADALSGFRAWAAFWGAHSPGGGHAPHSEFTRRQIWKEYYATLSTIMQHDLPYPITSLASVYPDASARLQQRAELHRVEARYESLLLEEVQFPRAEQASEEVEEWVDLVMSNWRVLCGNSWQESELGQGGREAVSRNVLDILYRAATKTFHSTPVLRHLFTVHLAVAEFALAFKAFDTYLEIVKKGKARVEKTGEEEVGLDDDEVVLQTASECIRALCRYGSRDAAEKAKGLAHFFEVWLDKHYPDDTSESTNGLGRRGLGNGSAVLTPIQISPRVFALAWRSIGISQAQWARLTFDAGSRAEIQLEAIGNLRKALSPRFESADDVDTLFALAMVLAERRDLGAAIDVVKTALLPPSQAAASSIHASPHQGKFAKERSLVPLWHLLALLLSARQDFTTAARSCEGAFEQFKDPKNLFGESQLNGSYRSEHLNRLELQSISEKPISRNRGLVDDMDDFERETLLEVKITQLILVEVSEGPDVAVNASDELLSLYSRLFDDPNNKVPAAAIVKPSQLNPPSSSAGTLRSIKGSIFGRSKRSLRKSSSVRGREVSGGEKGISATRPQTSQTTASTITKAPTIHVTNENGSSTKEPQHHEKLQKRTGSLNRKKSHGSVHRNRSTSTGRQRTATHAAEKSSSSEMHLGTAGSSEAGLAISPDNASLVGEIQPSARALSSMNHNMPQKEQSLTSAQPPTQDTRLPHLSSRSTGPVTRFPKSQERRRRTGLLIRVWLLIAGFYRRAEMYEDSKGAIDEAYKLVDNLETDVSKDTSGTVTLADGGWGAGKSVEELWADVISERGNLEIAQASPYAALSEFELALTHFADHPAATVGLSNILLDIYTEVLRPPPSIPTIATPEPLLTSSQSTLNIPLRPATTLPSSPSVTSSLAAPILHPLGLPSTTSITNNAAIRPSTGTQTETSSLEPPHKATSTAVLDRLAARDRAYGLLSALTKLGTAWTCSEAWYALSRAYEEGGQLDKAREVLWWCVELEEGRGVRDWSVVAVGGYVL